MNLQKIIPVFVFAGLIIFSVFAAIPPPGGDPVAGKSAYKICATCHGQNGEGVVALNSPAFASLPEWYVTRQLTNFIKGVRGTDPKDIYGKQMRTMSRTLSTDKKVADVAAYIASMERVKPASTIEGDVAAGKSLYVLCSTCHGEKGMGNESMGAPQLVGLQDWYLLRQLKNFKDGIRGINPDDKQGVKMPHMVKSLPDEKAMNDVLAFINTLR